MAVEFRDGTDFRKWITRIGAPERANIDRRLALLREEGLALGLPNVRRIDASLWELRSGRYRLYFTLEEPNTAVFVAYGNKDTQQRDIRRARERT